MDSNRLEDFIKRKVENYETLSDRDALWQKIKARQQLEKKPKRRFFLLWFSIGTLLVGSMLGLFFYNKKMTNKTNLSDVMIVPERLKETKKISEDKNITQKESIIKVVKNATTNTSNLQKITTKKNINKTGIKKMEKGTAKRVPEFIAISNNEKITKPGIQGFVNNQRQNSEENQEEHAIKPELEKGLPLVDDHSVVKPLTFDTKVETIPSLLTLLEIPQDNQLSLNHTKTTPKKWQISNGVYFTYGKAIRTLNGKNSETYLKTRNSSETSLDAIRAGMDIRFKHRKGWYFKTGLEYEQINERFENRLEWDSSFIAPDQIIAISYDTDGSSSEILGDGIIQEFYYSDQKIYNHYYSIDVPLVIGYESTNARLNWFAEAGPSINVWFQPDGKILDETGKNIELKEDNQLFRSTTGVSITSAVGLSWQLTPRVGIWGSPSLKYRLNSMTRSAYPLEQKYLNAGFSVGLRWH